MGILDLLGRKQDAISPEEFWRKTAEKRGADINYYTFAIFLGRSKDSLRDLPGLLYLAGDTLWFEDFEKDPGFLRLLSPKPAYVKTEISVPGADIVSAKAVLRKMALACVKGWMEPATAPSVTSFGRIFLRSAVEIVLSQGRGIYFEAMKEKELLELLPGAAPKQ
jgi:hypothetical protein